MTKIKICGLMREQDIIYANLLHPDYIGFVFAPTSRRYVSPETARQLRRTLHPRILAVGVFVNANVYQVADLLNEGTIQIAQLHGQEDAAYLKTLRSLTQAPLIQAFTIDHAESVKKAEASLADYILLDHGAGGTGKTFDWSLIQQVARPYFLAGGLKASNVAEALQTLHPYAVDTSSGVETNHFKDLTKLTHFISAIRTQHILEEV